VCGFCVEYAEIGLALSNWKGFRGELSRARNREMAYQFLRPGRVKSGLY